MKPARILFFILLALWSGQVFADREPGRVFPQPTNEKTVGCGILKGRLIYLGKNHDEFETVMEDAKIPDTEILKIIRGRYAQVFQEDRGYILRISWQVPADLNLDLKTFSLQYPAMIWTTKEGIKPQGVELKLESGRLELQAAISNFDFCLQTGILNLQIGEGASAQLFQAQWAPSSIRGL